MAKWTIRLVGSLAILRDAVPVRLRTRQQGLLLARLAVGSPDAIGRAETAALLWPEAPRANALAYLRRAVMELRELGIDIAATRDELSLAAGALACDLGDSTTPASALLEGFADPVSVAIRRIVSRRRKRTLLLEPAPSPHPSGAEGWLVDALLRKRSEVALDLIAEEGSGLVAQRPPAEVLRLCERALAISADESSSRGRVQCVAGRACMYLTRYGRAARYFEEALRLAGRIGDENLQAEILATHGFMLMEIRDWKPAIEKSTQAVEIANRLGDRHLSSLAHNSLAGILWNGPDCDFEGASKHYALATEAAVTEEVRLVIQANQAYIWAVFGVPFTARAEWPAVADHEAGLAGTMEAFSSFALQLGSGQFRGAAAWAARHLELTAGEGKERYLCVSLDCAAIAFGNLGMSSEAAATVRLGSRLRWSIGHRRAPAERLAIRHHVGGGFFLPAVGNVLAELDDPEPSTAAQRVAARLRIAATSD